MLPSTGVASVGAGVAFVLVVTLVFIFAMRIAVPFGYQFGAAGHGARLGRFVRHQLYTPSLLSKPLLLRPLFWEPVFWGIKIGRPFSGDARRVG